MVISEQEFEDGVFDFISGDEFEERTDEYMQALGFLALLSGRLPSEIFDDPEWPKHILFNMKCSNLVFKSVFDVLKLRN